MITKDDEKDEVKRRVINYSPLRLSKDYSRPLRYVIHLMLEKKRESRPLTEELLELLKSLELNEPSGV